MSYQTYMLFTGDVRSAKEELGKVGADILVDLTDQVLLVNIPEEIDVEKLEYSTTQKPRKLDLLSNLMVEVWGSRRPTEMKDLLEKLLGNEQVMITKIKNIDELS